MVATQKQMTDKCGSGVSGVEELRFTDRRVLVTGGAGFVGSHLTEALIDANEVVVLDDLSTGSRDHVPADAEFVEGDIRDRETIVAAMDDVDVVFHLAGVVSVPASIDDPERTQAINADATLAILEAARREEVRVVVASSAAVYGHPDTVPVSEDASKKPTSPYGLSKLTADEYVRLYADLYDLPAVALRYFNVYGPRQTGEYAGVIDVFLRQALAGDSLTVHGDGSQTRDLVHVSDVVQANLLAAVGGTPGVAYNVGTGASISIRNLAELVRDIVGTDVSIDHVDVRSGDIEDSCADITRISDAVGYEPTVELRDGLADLVQQRRAREDVSE